MWWKLVLLCQLVHSTFKMHVWVTNAYALSCSFAGHKHTLWTPLAHVAVPHHPYRHVSIKFSTKKAYPISSSHPLHLSSSSLLFVALSTHHCIAFAHPLAHHYAIAPPPPGPRSFATPPRFTCLALSPRSSTWP